MWTPTYNPLRALIAPILIETFFSTRPKSIPLKSIEAEPRFRPQLNILLKSHRVKWFLITSMNITKKIHSPKLQMILPTANPHWVITLKASSLSDVHMYARFVQLLLFQWPKEDSEGSDLKLYSQHARYHHLLHLALWWILITLTSLTHTHMAHPLMRRN